MDVYKSMRAVQRRLFWERVRPSGEATTSDIHPGKLSPEPWGCGIGFWRPDDSSILLMGKKLVQHPVRVE